MRQAATPSIKVESNLVYETVYSVMLSGPRLEDVVMVAVAGHLGIDPYAAGVKVKCYLSSSGSRDLVHSAKVTMTQDCRTQVLEVNATSI